MSNLVKIYGIIYKVTNLVNGKIYIGQTIRNMDKRWALHQNKNSNCLRLKAAIAKYGKEFFSVETIDSAINSTELGAKEMYWISHFDSINNGYNIKMGAMMTESIIEKIRSKNIGRKPSEAALVKMRAVVRTPEHKEMLRSYATGRIPWNKGMGKPKEARQRKTVIIHMLSKDYQLIQTFNCIRHAAIFLLDNKHASGDVKSISSNIRTKAAKNKGSAYGFRWKNESNFSQDFFEDYRPRPTPVLKPLIGYHKDGEIREFKSGVEAAGYINGSTANITRSIKTGYKVSGWKFEYLEDKVKIWQEH